MPIYAMARKIKQKNPNAIILFGGANCEYSAYLPLLKIECIDYCCSGYGNLLFTRLVECFLEGKQDMLYQIPGLHSNLLHQQRRNAGLNEEDFYYGEEDDITLSPRLDYSDFFQSFKKYFSDTNLKPRLFFETSRGCYWGEKNQCCSFCGINGGKPVYRKMDNETAIRYLNDLLSYKENDVFWATDSVMPPEYLDLVFPYLDISPNQHFFYEIRADLSDQQIEKMARYNINLVQVGIESFDDETLQLMKKGTTSVDNLRVLKKCSEEGIGILWNLLVGTPGEPEYAYKNQFDFIPYIYHFNPPSGVWAISFQKTSEYVHYPEKYGLILEPNINILEKIYPFSKEELGSMAYFYRSLSFQKTFSFKNLKEIYQLSHRVEEWKNAWLNKTPPMLYFLNERSILDSRNNISGIIDITLCEYDLYKDLIDQCLWLNLI
ncbi:MAG: RiPP maturation radical SAM C-methyltransferase [Clostridia bacterium]